MIRQKIKTFIWYESKAEEAANFYCSLFDNSRITKVTHYPAGAPAPAGGVMTVEFELAGVQFIALNGGPHFKLNEAISLSVDCESQEEVDSLWNKLTAEGQQSQCGWLKDKWGTMLPKLLSSGDEAKSARVMQAMMQMIKIDIAALERAAAGN
jgi:predicted 3-demethylubiquinone-9 3-methyltransferase (glyoxalase superfamily)